MINSKDTKVIKELVIASLYQAIKDTQQYLTIKPFVQKAFDIVIKEMKEKKYRRIVC